jgi:hypothetical protein
MAFGGQSQNRRDRKAVRDKAGDSEVDKLARWDPKLPAKVRRPFRDIVSELTVLRIILRQMQLFRPIWSRSSWSCDMGFDAEVFGWLNEITADCPGHAGKKFARYMRCTVSGFALDDLRAQFICRLLTTNKRGNTPCGFVSRIYLP